MYILWTGISHVIYVLEQFYYMRWNLFWRLCVQLSIYVHKNEVLVSYCVCLFQLKFSSQHIVSAWSFVSLNLNLYMNSSRFNLKRSSAHNKTIHWHCLCQPSLLWFKHQKLNHISIYHGINRAVISSLGAPFPSCTMGRIYHIVGTTQDPEWND